MLTKTFLISIFSIKIIWYQFATVSKRKIGSYKSTTRGVFITLLCSHGACLLQFKKTVRLVGWMASCIGITGTVPVPIRADIFVSATISYSSYEKCPHACPPASCARPFPHINLVTQLNYFRELPLLTDKTLPQC